MADQTVITLEPHGPAETGMPKWDPIPEDLLVSRNPIQTGHEYFSSAGGKLSAGVWSCTPIEFKFAPYDVNEFMMVLEGSIQIIDADGHVDTFSAGESFILPKGLPCTWKQTEYARKYYVIFDDPSGREPTNPTDLKAIRVDLSTTLPSMGEQDSTLFIGDAPQMNLLPLFDDVTAQYTVGLWESSPMQRKPAAIARSELMHILEGSGTITNADGVVFSFKAGDTFMVPIGMGYQWHSEVYVKKIFCSFTPST